MNEQQLEEHAAIRQHKSLLLDLGVDLLHEQHTTENTFFWLHLLWQVPSPRFESPMYLTELLQLGLLALRLSDIITFDRIVEELHEIATDLTKSRDL